MLLLVNLLLLRFCSRLLLTFESESHASLAAARPALVLVCETVSQSYGGLGMRITKKQGVGYLFSYSGTSL